MPNIALECGLLNSDWTDRNSGCQAAEAGVHLRRSHGQVAVGIDSPALSNRHQAVVYRPAVGALLPFVLGAGALERHATGVVADRADRGDVLVGETLLGRQRSQFHPLGLDWAGL